MSTETSADQSVVELIDQYLDQQHMMQLATVDGGQPWCCTVYYVHDSDLNLYWASLPTRRHSQEITKHARVAVAIAIRFTKGELVTGVQFAGTAAEMALSYDDRPIVEQYAAKFNRDSQWIDDMIAGRTEHRFYKLTADTIQLFDEAGSPDNPQQQVR